MNAPRAVKLVAALLLASAAAGLNAQSAFAQDHGASSHQATKTFGFAHIEDPQPSPTSTELSEAAKQAKEKAREAAKQAKEKAREAAKQANETSGGSNRSDKKSESKFSAGQLQLPPLVIRPATPNDQVSDDSDSGDSGAQNLGTGSGSQTAPTPAASADPNVITSGAGTGSKRFYVAPKNGANAAGKTSTTQPGSQNAQTGVDDKNSTADAANSEKTYVVSPLDESANSSNSGDSKFVKLADPTANEPIRIVAAATLKTPADQFFEMAGYGILVLALGAASLVSWGIYRGIKTRRSEVFDFEYRS